MYHLERALARIRANQGHSIDVDLALQPQEPPEVLLHGTAERFWGSIEDNGLEKRCRHHVHLSVSESVAMSVGQRYGTPVLLEIAAGKMFRDGFEFFRTANNVWLVDHVPVKYLTLISHEKHKKAQKGRDEPSRMRETRMHTDGGTGEHIHR